MEPNERDALLARHNYTISGSIVTFLRQHQPLIVAIICIISTICIGFIVFAPNFQSVEQNDVKLLQKSSHPIVQTSLGRLRGIHLSSRAGRMYNGFYNVPYAQPPIGNLRFMPPLPAKSWEGILDSTTKGFMCTQQSRYNPDVEVEGSEDCLHVNLFTPKLPSKEERPKFPVIVYFFGGGFMHGTANDFNCDYFMDEDVILVIVESRVGAFGYLSTGDLTISGNMGLKDQVMALRWVQLEIEHFGGDPNHVIAFGTSSGAICAHAHLLSPMTKGLFSGAMSFSGTILTPGVFTVNPKSTSVAFGVSMGCKNPENSESLLQCLQNVPNDVIALSQPQFSPSLEAIPLDGNMSQVFFPDTPVNLLFKGQANSVPWIVGVNSAEEILKSYTILLDQNKTNELNKNWRKVIPDMLYIHDQNQTVVEQITDAIHSFYFGNETISRYTNSRFNLTNMLSDREHLHPTKIAGVEHARRQSVYWYYLTKEASVSWADAATQYFDPPYGVSHADEVQYFFSRPRYPYIPLDSPYANFSILLVKLWVSFAKGGSPMNPDPNGIPWPKVNPVDNGHIWFNLDDKLKLVKPITSRLGFWDNLPFSVLYMNYNTALNLKM